MQRALLAFFASIVFFSDGLAAAAATPSLLDRPAFSATPAELLAGARELIAAQPDASVVTLAAEVRYDLGDDGRLRSRTREIYALAREGWHESWGLVEIGYAAWLGPRPEIRARVITPDGATHALDPQSLDERPAARVSATVYSDRRVVSAPLPRAKTGAVVEIEIVSEARAPIDGTGFVRHFFLANNSPTALIRGTVTAPKSAPLFATILGPERLPLAKSTTGDRQTVRVERRDVPALPPREPHLPDDVVTVPQLAFATGASWAEVARRYRAAVERVLADDTAARPMLEAAAREATQAGRAPAEVVARLSAWMRARVRYTGLELRDAAFIPQAPSTTLARGFGDCKDQAALFVALARAAGLRAHTVILSTDSSARAELPGLSTFDHMIAVVEGTPPLFVDPTATQHAPLSLPADDERRPALILAPTTTALTQTPAAPPTANGIREVRQVTLAAKGPGTVVESTEVWGQLAANYRRDWQGVAMTRVREQLEQYVKREYDAASVDEVQLEGLDDVDRPVRLRLTARKANRGFTGDDDAAVLVDVGALLANNLPEVVRTRPERNAPPRKGPLALGYAFTAEIRYAITVPTGFMVKALPPDETRALGVGTLTLRTGRAADGAVTALLTLVVDKPTLTPAELERARTAIVEALEDKPRFVLFHHIGLAAVAEGRAADGLAALRADVAREPDQPMHAVRLGRALMAIGFAPAAREALERALTRAPKSRELRAALAQVLTRDALGRDQAPALDLREAERLYRALRAEDPKDVAPRVALAALLERDAVGERWGKGARLAEAAAEYAKLGDELDHHAEDARYARVLLRLGRWADAEKVASKLTDAKQRDALSIVAWIGRDGTTPALARVRTAGIDRAAVATAADILIDLRRYDDAAVISEEVARGSGQEQVIRQMANAFRRVKAEPPPANAHDPFGHVRHFLWTLFGGTVDDVNRLVHPSERVDAFELAAMRRQAGAQLGQLPGHVLRDVAGSVTLVALDGDESIGWRVRVENAAGDRQELFVARDGGKLQITPVAILAQRLVAAQRWKETARVLRWAREGSATPAQMLATLWDGAREDPAALRLATAGLLVLTTKESVAFDLLSTCAERPDAPERETCATLFAFGLSTRNEHQRLCDLYPRLQPALSGARANVHRAYISSLSRLPDGRARLEALLGADDPLDPGHAVARNALVEHLLRRGDRDRAIPLVAALHAEGKASPGTLNNAAWAMLFAPTLDARAVTWAEEAVRATNRREPAFLGTLASVLAAAGKPDAAREVLFELVRNHRADALSGGDRYTLGAIAAAYGLSDAARAAWSGIVGRKDDESALSVDKLAREQLRRLP